MRSTSRDSATQLPVADCPEDKAREALALMIGALELIDSGECASVAGAHLDLAIHRLQEWIEREPPK